MYNEKMLESMKKVAEKRAANAALEPRRMTADEKDALLAKFHPDYKKEEFRTLSVGMNKGEKVPTELCALLEANSRIDPAKIDLSHPDYETDVPVSYTHLTLPYHRRRRRGFFRGDRSERSGSGCDDRHKAPHRRCQHDDGGRRHPGGG